MWSYKEVGPFLGSLKSQYGTLRLCDYEGQPGVLLRHDVDLDVSCAFDLSQVEEEHRVHSTFFFLVTGDTYNVSSARNRTLVRRMSEAGFEVGLHFDPTIYEACDNNQLARYAEKEAGILEDIIGATVRSVSIHNPTLLGHFPLFDGWRNAYDPKIFAPDKYLSDSCMTFRHEPPAFLARAKKQTVQLLLHPEHYSKDGLAYPHPMLNYVADQAQRVHASFMKNPTYARNCGDTFFTSVAETMRNLATNREAKSS